MAAHPLIDALDTDLNQALREIAATNDAIAKSVVLYDLTKALFKAGLAQQVATVAEEMRKFIRDLERHRSDEVRAKSYGNACKALAITDGADEVNALVADFPRIAGSQWDDTDTGGTLFALCDSILDDTDDVEKALALIHGISDKKISNYAYGSVCKAYARLGQADNALRLASRIGDEPPLHQRSFCLTMCAETLGDMGAAEDALIIAQQIAAGRFRLSALFSAAQSFANLGRDNQTRTILEQALAIPGESRSQREFAMVRASTALATLGHIDEALAVASQIDQERPRYFQAIANICRAMAHRGNLSEAQSLASKIENRDVVALGIVKGLTSAGRLEEAENILGRIKDEEQRSEGWETLGRKLSHGSHTSETLRIVEHLPEFLGNSIVRLLVESLAKEGKYQDAVAIVAQRWSSNPISRVEVLASIFYWARAGNPQLADPKQLEVADSGRPVDVGLAEFAFDVGQQTSDETTKKGFFRKNGFFSRLFG